jgi:hypothetical protein
MVVSYLKKALMSGGSSQEMPDATTEQVHEVSRLRRAVPRQPADWCGFFRFDDAESDAWRCCRVVDISPLGAGLELFGVVDEDHMDGPITVSIELRGTPRNMTNDAGARSARVDVQFAEPSEAAKRYMKMLNGVRSRW